MGLIILIWNQSIYLHDDVYLHMYSVVRTEKIMLLTQGSQNQRSHPYRMPLAESSSSIHGCTLVHYIQVKECADPKRIGMHLDSFDVLYKANVYEISRVFSPFPFFVKMHPLRTDTED